MMKTALVLTVAGLATAASADLITASAFGPHAVTAPTYGEAAGDVTNTVNAIFDAGGGIILNSLAHTVDSSEAMTAGFRPTTMTTTVTTVGSTRTITMEWLTDGGAFMVEPGDSATGAGPVTTLSFEHGSANAAGNGIDDPDFVAYNHPFDGTSYLGAFDLLGAGGAVLFSGSYFLQLPSATEMDGRTFISAGGGDLSGFGITGGRSTWSYEIVPAPASAALLGLGGFAAARRRR